MSPPLSWSGGLWAALLSPAPGRVHHAAIDAADEARMDLDDARSGMIGQHAVLV